MTINEAMVLQRALRGRVSDLQQIRNANLVRTRRWDILQSGAEKERTEIEPQYNPKAVDAKITEIELFLFRLDTAIKRANARASIEGVNEADVNKLLEPIQ